MEDLTDVMVEATSRGGAEMEVADTKVHFWWRLPWPHMNPGSNPLTHWNVV